jgi:hypothetical protein
VTDDERFKFAVEFLIDAWLDENDEFTRYASLVVGAPVHKDTAEERGAKRERLRAEAIEHVQRQMRDAKLDHADVLYLHRYSSRNRGAVAISEECGCFYCVQIFKAFEVETYTPHRPKKGVRWESALCPRCGMDALLPSSEVALSLGLLQEMYEYWFERDDL